MSSGGTQNKKFLTRDRLLQMAAILLSVGISIAIFMFRHEVEDVGNVGYLGVFLISILVSATVVLPAPGWIIIGTLGAVLNPYLVGVISALGGTIGELTGYMLGYGGRSAIKNVAMYQRLVGWMKRWGGLIIFVLAAIPNPLFDIAGMAAGALRMPVWKFMLFGAAGRIPKHIVYAVVGSWGLGAVSMLK